VSDFARCSGCQFTTVATLLPPESVGRVPKCAGCYSVVDPVAGSGGFVEGHSTDHRWRLNRDQRSGTSDTEHRRAWTPQSCKRADGTDYACGIEATAALVQIMQGREVECAGSICDFYGRPLVRCHLGADDIGAMMVRSGGAVAEFKRSTIRSKKIGLGLNGSACGRDRFNVLGSGVS